MQPSEPPEHFNFAEDVLGARAAECPDRTALLFVDEHGSEARWTFGDFAEQSSRLAHVLQAHGLRRGDIALVMISTLPQAILARLAVMKAGGASLLLRHRTTAREVAHFVERAAPRLAIAGPADAGRFPPDLPVLVSPSPALEDALGAVSPDFPSLRLRRDEPEHIVLTGGTTGLPKMVVHTHGSRAYHYLRWTVSFEPDDLSWDLAGRWWLGAWRQGTPVFDRALPTVAGPEIVLQTLAAYPITRMMGPARLFSELVRQDLTRYPLSRLRGCWSAGQALDPTITRSWVQQTGIPLYDRYGQSEVADAPFQQPDVATSEAGGIGIPYPWVEMAVIDEDGRRLPVGALGDIAIKASPVRPPWLFREYLGDPAATAARHRGDWYLTGDVGRMDETGCYYLAGRAYDVINCGATNIGPAELELVLQEHPAVREVAVIGKPHRDLGEIPKAYVVLETGHDPGPHLASELIEYVAAAIHPHKRLREVEFAESLPRTPEGKLRRGELHAEEVHRAREPGLAAQEASDPAQPGSPG
jgi:acyl-coenzyme A synthetase/AMP-(fatty) acid ligase